MLTAPTARILAVDDTPDNLFLLEALLGEVKNYQVQLADSGEAALESIKRSPPDVILLDVMMPKMDGYAVTRAVRGDSAVPYIPILLLTAHEQSNLVRGLDAGADDFLRKPFDVDELLARVRSMVRLKQSIDAHRYMVQQRDDFVARLTHDLRTPLVAANRMLEMCLQGTFGGISDDVQAALDSIVTNNANLLAMANTLLEVYRHDAGQKLLCRTPVDLDLLCQDIHQELMPLASEKGLALQLMVDSPGATDPAEDGSSDPDACHTPDYTIHADALELRRLITNLISNALKFTDAGTISLCLRRQADRTIILEVTDTGVGISETDQQQIFEWFRQGQHLRAGSGLGLHLSQRIAQLHGGQITVTSVVGQGSTFRLTLPQPPASVHHSGLSVPHPLNAER